MPTIDLPDDELAAGAAQVGGGIVRLKIRTRLAKLLGGTVLIGLAALQLAETAAAQSQPTDAEVAALTKATTVFQLCVEASRDQSWARLSPESVPSDYATTTSEEGPNYAAWAKSFNEASAKITQSCKVAYPYDAATVCRWMPDCDDYLVMLAQGVMNGARVCDKAWKKCRTRNSAVGGHVVAQSNVPFPDLPDPTPFCRSLAHEAQRNYCLRQNQDGYETAKALWPELSQSSAEQCAKLVIDWAKRAGQSGAAGYPGLGDCAVQMHEVDEQLKARPDFHRD